MRTTGKTRLAIHNRWFRKPIIKLQIQVIDSEHYRPDLGELEKEYSRWIDATTENIYLDLNSIQRGIEI